MAKTPHTPPAGRSSNRANRRKAAQEAAPAGRTNAAAPTAATLTDELPLDEPAPPAVSSDPAIMPTTPAPPAGALNMETPETTDTTTGGEKSLVLKQKPGARASDRLVIFDLPDRKGSVQFLRTLFPEAGVPETITISGNFSEPKTAREKIVETKEERKARLAALPKLTLADQIAKSEKRAEELRAKLAKKLAAEAAKANAPAGDAAEATA